jgi:hypothetical protein
LSRLIAFILFVAGIYADPITITQTNSHSGSGCCSGSASVDLGPNVSGLGSYILTAEFGAQANVSGPPSGFLQVGIVATLEINAYTPGPLRPGYLLVDSFSESDGSEAWQGEAGASLNGIKMSQCSGENCSQGGTSELLPVNLGESLTIILNASSFASASMEGLDAFGGGGGAATQISIQAIDPAVCNCATVQIMGAMAASVPEPSPLITAMLGLAAMVTYRRISGTQARVVRCR